MRKYLSKLYYILWAMFIALWVIFTANGGISQWQQWLDLKGGVRLLYQMDFSQYKKNYKTEAAFNQQRQNVINIVKKNIDGRISKLWVSDYNAKNVVLWGKDYIEVEIWGVKDVEKAKKIIWKTVQMTFKVPYEWTITPEIKAERQLFAEKILEMVVKNDKNLKDYLPKSVVENVFWIKLATGEVEAKPRAWNVYPSTIVLSGSDLKNVFW